MCGIAEIMGTKMKKRLQSCPHCEGRGYVWEFFLIQEGDMRVAFPEKVKCKCKEKK